jgi:hypothetical protein
MLDDVLARVQRLIEAPRPAGGYPLEWHVQVAHIGDVTALATLALRSPPHSTAA